MTRETILRHEFVKYIPIDLKGGTLYVSMAFATVAHKCCCGCGKLVITPLPPTDWKLTFDGESISLDPSIGNWNFDCQSHYWIKNSLIRWSRRWSQHEIEAARLFDRVAKQKYFGGTSVQAADSTIAATKSHQARRKDGLWQKLKKLFS